ncbi:MAG: hypothetical protein KY395_05160 [Actinobacteria bacterium]|nr:hypothetical protein [Actinomycetota bacterium]
MYHQTIESSGDRTEEETSWIITHLDGERFEQTSAVGRDGDPDEKSTNFTIKWSAEAATRIAMQFPAVQADERRRCDLEPPLLIKPLPLEVGLTWESASVCGKGARRTIEEFSGKVVRTERTQVAGVELDTFVIETSSGAGQRGRFWFTVESTDWFSPELGMTVRRTAVKRETETGGGFRQEITTALLTWPGSPPG